MDILLPTNMATKILAFLQEFFSRGAKSIVMQISSVVQIFLLFLGQILGGGSKSLQGGAPL